MWLGVAMITVPGETQKQRALASMLSTHGAAHTIARNLDEYRLMAVQLARRPILLRKVCRLNARGRDQEKEEEEVVFTRENQEKGRGFAWLRVV